MKIVAEMDDVDGCGWENLAPTSPVKIKKTLSYHDYMMIMRSERELEKQGDL